MHDGARHADGDRCVADGQVSGPQEVRHRHGGRRTSEALPRGANSGETRRNPFGDSRPLKLRIMRCLT